MQTSTSTNRMSPSVKSKSKSQEKASQRAGKEQHKTSPQTSVSPTHGSGVPASPQNPILGTFQTPETLLVASSIRVHDTGHFTKVEDADEHSSSPQGAVSESDSVSINGSCSGESEESKEKVAVTNSSTRPDSVPGCDSDRREKIRLKNERKHQRQRERRAQELHDRCRGYLLSRKLESLAQQLVAMGFSSERATLALMLNDGKLEQSVSWLFEANEEQSQTKDTTSLVSEGNLKIDITDELVQISALEVKYNCSKQEVERAIVAYEGDLQKAENTLKTQKQEQHGTQSKSEDSGQNSMRSQGLPAESVSMQQRESESDFNHYSKDGGSDSMFPDLETGNVQSLQPNHPNFTRERRWSGVPGSSPSSAMLAMAPSMQAVSPLIKMEAGMPIGVANEGRMTQQGLGREPVMMQHPQFTNAKQNSMVSLNSFPSGAAGWYVNSIAGVENVRSNGKLLQTQSVRSISPNHLEQFCQAPYKEYSHFFGPVDYSSAGVGGFCKPMGASSTPPPSIPPRHHGSWSMNVPPLPALTVPTSLGLFSGHHNAARTFSSHPHMDWNTGGLMPEFDYTSIDWSLNVQSSSGGACLGISSLLRNSYGNRRSSPCMSGLQNVGMNRESSSSGGLREWTTPFAGKDLFSVPRQFVTSPPM
ncbi:uncharacterized protein HKW66_Vig0228710 [Vigna angularis]|uniref:UBA domain-containing protein n=3 Tax=Phaseolus angularis TaxID=3914 RepID=A0A8T0KAH0_PHAAN|nr:uncharacterized protein HKW66_Vig0228710 [Vigna angularis]